jgi:hydroxypyruvate isomerase
MDATRSALPIFAKRFAAAAAAGFEGVEFLFPYDFAPAEIAARLKQYGLSQALFNLPPGDWAGGERGMAALPGREKEFMVGLDRALWRNIVGGPSS